MGPLVESAETSQRLDALPASPRPVKLATRGAVRFRADLDLAELDDRRRPGASWIGRGIELSRSHLSLRSKRMCYAGRLLLVAVHMVDDRPVPLFGQVRDCEYDGDGLYRTEITLLEMPDEEPIRAWIKTRGALGSM